MDRVPAGFVPHDSVDLDPDRKFKPTDLPNLVQHDKLPCTLYTDRYGSNIFVLNVNGTDYFLQVRTD